MSKAEEALYDNNDEEVVVDLMNDLRDATGKVEQRFLALERLREFEHLLNEELNRLQSRRDEEDKQTLDAEIERTATRLGELDDTFKNADETKKAFDKKEQELRDRKAELDGDESASDDDK